MILYYIIAPLRSDVCGIAKTGSGKTMAFAVPYLSMSRIQIALRLN